MSLETLHAAQTAAAERLSINTNDLEELQRPEVYEFNLKGSDGSHIPAVRVHTGKIDGFGAKGGIRFDAKQDPVVTATELSGEMLAKNNLWAVHHIGGKAVIGAVANQSYEEKAYLTRQFAEQMHEAGLSSPYKDSPAGDIGSNGLADVYASRMQELGEKYWMASVTGKSPENGGLSFRPAATGFGAHVIYATLRDSMRESHSADPDRLKFQGFGNVGSFQSYFASKDPYSEVAAISDIQATLTVADGSMHITQEMVDNIGNDPKFKGDKMAALREEIRANQGIDPLYISHADHPDAIYTAKGNAFVPAALPNVVNDRTLPLLMDAGLHYNIESGNGVTTLNAHSVMTRHGIIVPPDFLTNGGGVKGSSIELLANIAAVDFGTGQPTDQEVMRDIETAGKSALQRTLDMAKALDTNDLRVAAAAVHLAQLSLWTGLDMDRSFHEFAVNDIAQIA